MFMRTISVLCGMLAAALLASCATMATTTIVTRQRLDQDFVGKLAYENVDASSVDRRFTPGDLDQLKEAVRARVPQPADGGVPVTLRLAVTDYGAGGGKMVVAVQVVDAGGKSYARFDVYQTANTALGAVVDQRSSVINAIADGVARALMAMPVAPPSTLDARNYGS